MQNGLPWNHVHQHNQYHVMPGNERHMLGNWYQVSQPGNQYPVPQPTAVWLTEHDYKYNNDEFVIKDADDMIE